MGGGCCKLHVVLGHTIQVMHVCHVVLVYSALQEPPSFQSQVKMLFIHVGQILLNSVHGHL